MTIRRPLLAPSLLALLVLGSACPPSTPTTPPPVDEPATAPEVLEWLLGEQVRGGGPTEPDTNVGIITIAMGTETLDRGTVKSIRTEGTADKTPMLTLRAMGTAQTASCAPDLVQLIPFPGRPGVRFAINESGALLLYAGDGWSPVPSAKTVPPIDKLIASSTEVAGLQLLVALRDQRHELHLLTLYDDQVTDVLPVDLGTIQDRRSALSRYDSGRCIDDRDCLHLISVDGDFVLMREPELYENYVEVGIDPGDGVRDMRYADAEHTMLDVLTTDACTSAEPSAAPEASP